jgi:hypothetical protein
MAFLVAIPFTGTLYNQHNFKTCRSITNKKIWVTLNCGQFSAKSDNIENYEFCALFSVAESLRQCYILIRVYTKAGWLNVSLSKVKMSTDNSSILMLPKESVA